MGQSTNAEQPVQVRLDNYRQSNGGYDESHLVEFASKAVEALVEARFRELDEARFMRTGGHRRYRVKAVDARVALAVTVASAFYGQPGKPAEMVWFALANGTMALSYLERGAVALLKRKNELLESVRTIHALMPDIERAVRFAAFGDEDGG